MREYVFFVGGCILIPFVIGLIKVSILPKYLKPFLVNLGIGVLSETIGHYSIFRFGTNMAVYNVYYLLDLVTMAYFFYGFEIMTAKQKGYFKIICILLIGVWVVDNFMVNKLNNYNYSFDIAYSFVLVICSILLFTTIIIKNNEQMSKLPIFYITVGLLLYYTFDCFIKLLVSPLFNASRYLQKYIWIIFSTIILFKYILFSVGFLWVKKK
jgi:hypothetical protein